MKLTFSKISARKQAPENSRWPFYGKNPLKMGNYTMFGRFENPRRGMQARILTTNVLKILDLKLSLEKIFSKNCRWVPLICCSGNKAGHTGIRAIEGL